MERRGGFLCGSCRPEDMEQVTFQTVSDIEAHHVDFHGSSESRNFNCAVCSLKSIPEAKMEEHLNSHLKGKTYECGICHEIFPERIHIMNHLRNEHGVTTSLRCPYCLLKFPTINNIESHVKSRHNNEWRTSRKWWNKFLMDMTNAYPQSDAEPRMYSHFGTKETRYLDKSKCEPKESEPSPRIPAFDPNCSPLLEPTKLGQDELSPNFIRQLVTEPPPTNFEPEVSQLQDESEGFGRRLLTTHFNRGWTAGQTNFNSMREPDGLGQSLLAIRPPTLLFPSVPLFNPPPPPPPPPPPVHQGWTRPPALFLPNMQGYEPNRSHHEFGPPSRFETSQPRREFERSGQSLLTSNFNQQLNPGPGLSRTQMLPEFNIGRPEHEPAGPPNLLTSDFNQPWTVVQLAHDLFMTSEHSDRPSRLSENRSDETPTSFGYPQFPDSRDPSSAMY